MNDSGDPQRSHVTLRQIIIAAGAVLLAVCLWRARQRPAEPPTRPDPAPLPTRLEPDRMSDAEADRSADPVGASYQRDVERPKPVQSAPAAAAGEDPAEAPSGNPQSRMRDEKKALPEIFRMPAGPAPVAAPPQAHTPPQAAPVPRDGFAPFGRLVRCQLVDAVDSVTARSSPIVAVVTDELDWNGSVIIPAGTEAFSYAKPEAILDAGGVGRLVDSGEWTLVLPRQDGLANGRELVLRGRAIDREEAADGSWQAGDGTDGLVGEAVATLNNEEIKLFAAAAIGGMAQGIAAVAERQQPAAGVAGALGATQIAPTLGNAAVGAAGSGTTAVMSEVAGRIRDEISRHGVFVRVPAGKLFYLFVEQTIDARAARIGLRLAPVEAGPR